MAAAIEVLSFLLFIVALSSNGSAMNSGSGVEEMSSSGSSMSGDSSGEFKGMSSSGSAVSGHSSGDGSGLSSFMSGSGSGNDLCGNGRNCNDSSPLCPCVSSIPTTQSTATSSSMYTSSMAMLSPMISTSVLSLMTPTTILPITTPTVVSSTVIASATSPPIPPIQKANDSLSLSIGLGMVGGLLVVIILLMVAITITGVCFHRSYFYPVKREEQRRRRMVVFSNHNMIHLNNTSNDSTPSHQSSDGRGYCPRQPQSFGDLVSHIPQFPAVELSDLKAYVKALRVDQAMEEYEYVRDSDVQFYTFTACLKCNKNKNRYVNILANEFTRVCLHTPSGQHRYSDYINANYIEGYSKQKEYIATQGPLEKTTADFWSMVWSENCKSIVMVTNLVEDNKLKCFKYWASGGVLLAHSLSVVLQDEEILPDYTVRTFNITLKDERYDDSGECRQVTQYHFTAWPDHGVPRSTASVVAFVRRVRSATLPTDGPIITHCSAGIGRTGTFITIDVMLQKIDHKEPIDIMSYVCRIRAQRSSMVQTYLQYMFIYEAVLHAALPDECSVESGSEQETSEDGKERSEDGKEMSEDGEVRSEGGEVRSEAVEVRSEAVDLKSDGEEVKSDDGDDGEVREEDSGSEGSGGSYRREESPDVGVVSSTEEHTTLSLELQLVNCTMDKVLSLHSHDSDDYLNMHTV